MRTFTAIACLLLLTCLISCSRKESAGKTAGSKAAPGTTGQLDTTKSQTPPIPISDRYYVLDKKVRTIFEIDLNQNTISKRFLVDDNIVAIAYDAQKDWVYEAYGKPKPALKVLDPKAMKFVLGYDFVEPPSDILFHPVKRLLFIVSEDSTYFRVFAPDSLKILFKFPLWVVNRGFIGPRVLAPGPSGKIISANGARAGVTEIMTDNNYAYQTIVIHEAKFIDNAVFSFDGNSAYCCDSKAGKIFKVEFGSGAIQARKESLDHPRYVQFEVTGKKVILAVGKNQVLMLHPDTFVEMGKVSLDQYGDEILSLQIPPKANFAEVLMDYKGVTRWIRFSLDNWEPVRLIELI